MRLLEDVNIRLNLDLLFLDKEGRVLDTRSSHNIITNAGRQFMAECISAQAFAGANFTRHQDDIVRYIGFGIGGTRQNDADALDGSSALSLAYPGTNLQTDVDVAVSALERPIPVTEGPDVWMKEITTPGTFPTATSTRFSAIFSQTDLSGGSFPSVPISEIALFKGAADPSLPNGTAGAYPGVGGQVIAYDTFNAVAKTGVFAIEVRWTWRF